PFVFVALKADGTLLGKCGFAPIETPVAPDALRGQVQIGWTLRADHWGHGYAREAAEAMLALGFARLGLTTVFAQTSQRNPPAWEPDAGSWGRAGRLGLRRRAGLDYADADPPPKHTPTMAYRLNAASWPPRASTGTSRAAG